MTPTKALFGKAAVGSGALGALALGAFAVGEALDALDVIYVMIHMHVYAH
jgi:hypothetical protein